MVRSSGVLAAATALFVTNVTTSWAQIQSDVAGVDVSLEGGAAGGLGVLISDPQSVRRGDDVDALLATYLELTAERLADNGVSIGLAMRVEQEAHAFDDLRFGLPSVGGVAADPRDRLTLERARVNVVGPFGELVLGRDDGAAERLSVISPQILRAVALGDDERDALGLSGIHTVNDFSGFGAKASVYSPQFLGVRVGASYTPRPRACGAGFCAGARTESWRNVTEAAVRVRRGFENGVRIQGAATFLEAQDEGAQLDSDRFRAYGLGLNVGVADLRVGPIAADSVILGGSVVNSNNGVTGRRGYTAYDAGVTFESGSWGFMLSYGEADDDALAAQTRAFQTGVRYRVSERWAVGSALQWVERHALTSNPDTLVDDEEAAAVVFESSINF